MALAFVNGSTDKVICGDQAALRNLNAGTIMIWLQCTSTGASNKVIVAKCVNSGGSGWHFRALSSDGSQVLLFVDRATTDFTITSPTATLDTTNWICLGVVWNVTGGTGAIYKGTLSTAMADTSATVSAGSGAQADDTGQNYVLGNAGTASLAWSGRIAAVGLYGSEFSSAEMQSWQKNPRVVVNDKRALAWHALGLTGTGTQVDRSGGGSNGTITGATFGAEPGPGLWARNLLSDI